MIGKPRRRGPYPERREQRPTSAGGRGERCCGRLRSRTGCPRACAPGTPPTSATPARTRRDDQAFTPMRAVAEARDGAIDLARVLFTRRRVDEDRARERPPAAVVREVDRLGEEVDRSSSASSVTVARTPQNASFDSAYSPRSAGDVGDECPRHDRLARCGGPPRPRAGAPSGSGRETSASDPSRPGSTPSAAASRRARPRPSAGTPLSGATPWRRRAPSPRCS